jgi:predicted small lipoprotein YifL
MRLRLMSMILLAALASLALSGGKLSPPSASARAATYAQDERQDKEKHKRGDDYDTQKDKRRYDNDDSEFTERDEFRQSYALAPGAQVRVSGMNGSVEVETSAGGGAEVYVLRTARNRSDLDYHKVVVEQTAAGLVVRGVNDDDHKWRGDNHQVRQRVTMRIPRNVEFTASGINGKATVGELDGPVKLSGINGRADVAQARGYVDISEVNGAVTMLITQITERGIRVSDVNGSVVLRFDGTLNADLTVNGVNGSVNADMPNVTLQGRVSRSSFNAKIGGGGAPINVSSVNGSVKLLPRS